MDTAIRLVILAQPGRSRDSLVALLRTLRPAGLFPVDPAQVLAADRAEAGKAGPAAGTDRLAWLPGPLEPAPILLIDLVGIGASGGQVLALLQRRWPGARTLALVETLRLAGGPAQGADCILHRSVAAGELLAAVQRLAGRSPVPAADPRRRAALDRAGVV